MTAETVSIDVSALNELLVCKLCSGYYRDAHTISECLHTFCKNCISKHFYENTARGNVTCPDCQVTISTTIPSAFTKLIYDRNLQSIVDKIFPQFAEEDAEKARLEAETLKKNMASQEVVQSILQIETDTKERPAKKSRVDTPQEPTAKPETTTGTGGGGESAGTGSESKVDYLVKLVPLEDPNISENKRLPILPKPSFRSDFVVKLVKIQGFVHKRLPAEVQATLSSQQIDIYFNNKVITHLDYLDRIKDEILTTFANNPGDGLIILGYRKK